jgi:hypothetical protein
MKTVRTLCSAGAIVIALAGCSDLLEVSDPGAIQDEQLSDPALEQLMVNGAIGEFQFAYGSYVQWSGVLADEVFTDHTNVSVREFSLHNFIDLNDTNESVYVNLQRARASGDDTVERLKQMLGAAAGSSLNVARALAYGGYAYVLLGEGFCEAPINLSAGVPSDDLLRRAITRFDEAITVATAARVAPNVAVAQDLIYMAQVGAARAALKLGDLPKARGYAVQVPASYEKLVYFSANSVRENNPIQASTRTSGGYLGTHPTFQFAVADPRVPRSATTRPGLNSNPLFTPLRPLQYSGWSATTAQVVDIPTGIKFATGLEAQYVVAEADGPIGATLTFVNARRAVGNQAPVTLTGTALMTELRDQRARDFFLTGQRLGDLRRYDKAGTDLFPKGKYPVFPDPYGALKCFIVPLSEKAGNPNY